MSRLVASQRAWLAPAWVREDLSRKAQALPSLDLRFAERKTLTDAASGQSLVTFTRASSGTYVGSDGVLQTAANDVPRFDHNPTTGESLGLLVEEQRTNLLGRSEEFDEANWAKYSATISANSIAGPNGLSTADTIVSAAATAQTGISRYFTATAAAHTGSFFVKANGANAVQLLWSGSISTNYANFDLSTGAVAAGTYSAASIQAFPNGWYRISITSTLTSATTGFFLFLIDSTGAARGGSFTGNGTSGVYVWGAQVEAGAFPTSYIPTTTATATRSADVASITGTNFSSWYRQDEWTVFADAKEYQFASGVSRAFYGFDASSAPNTDYIRQWIWSGASGSLLNSVYTSASGPVAAEFSQLLANEQKSVATAVKANDFARSYNGNAAVVDAAGNMPVGIDRLGVGSTNNSLFMSGHIRRLTYWPQRLSNSVLQAITR